MQKKKKKNQSLTKGFSSIIKIKALILDEDFTPKGNQAFNEEKYLWNNLNNNPTGFNQNIQ